MFAKASSSPKFRPAGVGEVALRVSAVSRKIGTRAWPVLEYLIQLEAYHGSAHPTRAGILRRLAGAPDAPTSIRGVSKALDRLRDLGLLERRWTWGGKDVPNRRYGEVHELRRSTTWDGREFIEGYTREEVLPRVIRARLSTDGATLVVPATVARKINESAAWGGFRAGAGRPKESKGVTEYNREKTLDSKIRNPESLDPSLKPTGSETPTGSPTLRLEAGASAPTRASEPVTAPAKMPPAPIVELFPGALQPIEGCGIRLGGRGPRPPEHPCLEGAPPYPTMEEIRPAVVPPPPLLDPDAPDEELAHACLRAYRSAVEAATGRQCWVLKGYSPAKLRRWSGYARLVEGAQMLLACGVPPAAWCAFSIQAWRKHVRPASGGRAPPSPPISWIYQVTRIADHGDWFMEEEGGLSLAGRVVFGPAARELIARYDRMAVELRTTSWTRADAARIVGRHFPGDLHRRLVERARAEGDAERRRLAEALKRGEWIW